METGGRGLRQFAGALEAVMAKLARMLISDAEGATKLITVTVRGAASRRDALIAARSVANSPLVKAAINGNDPNWGRIMMALGKCRRGSTRRRCRSPSAMSAWSSGDAEGRCTSGADSGDHGASGIRRHDRSGLGRGEDRVWTCDLSEEYVRLNSKYTT
jgi:glutamate N-acetyltransferase/amino-acid N-acetyltransferase